MRKDRNVQSFKMKDVILRFDLEKSILLCHSKFNNKKLWVKKLNALKVISDIIEDNKKYYLACDSGEINGQFIAIQKDNGITDWFIPGKSFLHLIYKGFLYLIFSDTNGQFYLLKVHLADGKSAWFHPVDQDLNEYIFLKDKIKLSYLSGKTEILSIRTGKLEFNK